MKISIKTIKPWKTRPRVGKLVPMPPASKTASKARHHGRPRTTSTP